MTKIFRHIAALLCVALAVVMTACDSRYDMPQDPADDGRGTFLVFNIGMLGATRAASTSIPDNESLHSLRIMILNDQGVVENNEYFTFGSSCVTYSHITKLKSRFKKKVYLFANEESVTDIQCEPANVALSGSLHDFLESVTEGATGFEAKIAAVNFTPDFSKPIPLNAIYDVEIPAGVKYVEKSFWLVRTAAKFTFTFINKRKYADITVNGIEVNGIADRQFFMPKFTNDETPVFPGFATWIDWLKDVSDKTQVDPDNPSADTSGWLTAYDIPTAANIGKLSYTAPFTIEPTPATSVYGKEIADLYCCESKNLRSDGMNAVPMEQQYTVHLECTGYYGNDEEHRTYDITLPNLRALFRNTHPHVIISFTEEDYEVKAVVDVVPYRGCILDPYFGLARE
ncbi:MAG: hypothetical protein K2N13_08235 [Paraprevotella sp.]|nr:hypothetical protein [Paraprevotella sp.]